MAIQMKQDLKASGFTVNEQKSPWVPAQILEILGSEIDLKQAVFRVPEQKAERVRLRAS